MRFSEWDIGRFDRDAAIELCKSGFSPLNAVLLAARGISTRDGACAFLNDSISLVSDPFLLTDMEKAVSVVENAVQNGAHIAVYGDYDVDGMTASALLADYLHTKSASFEVYIPDRLEEGYGLSRAALDILKTRGVDLIITVDCGITAIDEAVYAKELGITLVVTDHHECRDELPNCAAVVDPKRSDCSYPNKHLAGVGVCFKLVCALERDTDINEMLNRYGGLVAIGTVADVMPVIDENRVLIRRGLLTLNNYPRAGLRNLLRVACLGRRINTATIGFALAPRLNAAGRMGRTNVAIDLLMTDDEAEGERLTDELCRLNVERRRIETETFEEAVLMLPDTESDGPVILARRGWHQGVMGIVAARMAERHFSPSILISVGDDGIGRGSCRSFGGFSLYNALQSCGDILLSYGGHEMAAGITIAEENVPELQRRIYEYYHENIENIPKPRLILELEVEKPELLTEQNLLDLEVLEPFGNHNPPPCLCMKNAELISAVTVGDGKHSRLKIEKSGKTIDCIFFSTPADNLGVKKGMRVDIAFEPQINYFRGKTSVQLHVFDIRPHLPA